MATPKWKRERKEKASRKKTGFVFAVLYFLWKSQAWSVDELLLRRDWYDRSEADSQGQDVDC